MQFINNNSFYCVILLIALVIIFSLAATMCGRARLTADYGGRRTIDADAR